MNIKNINEGQIIKNYRELCRLLDNPITDGNSKKAQLKEFERYVKYHKESNKFIIDKIYDKPKEKKKIQNNRKYFPQYKVDMQYDNLKGVYKITQGNTIYVGSTTVGFRLRFIQHISKNNPMFWTRNLLQSGGNYEIIWIAPKNETTKNIRKMEKYYIRYYKNLENMNLINDRGLIEQKEYKMIKVSKDNYNKVIELLKENDLLFKNI